mgnify:CR=1 FL=1
MSKKTILLVDNSLDTTGAFNALLRNVLDLKDEFNFIFVIHQLSVNDKVLKKLEIKYYKLNMIEISKRPYDLLLYLPQLLLNAIRLSKIVRDEKVSIIHVNDVYNMLGILTKCFSSITLVTHIRRMPESFPRILYKTWHFFHVRFTDVITAVSGANASFFNEHKNIHVIYDKVVDNEKLAYDNSNNARVTKILYLANYTRGKGQEHALKALKLMLKQYGGKVQLNFYGGDFGLSKNLEFKQELIQESIKMD